MAQNNKRLLFLTIQLSGSSGLGWLRCGWIILNGLTFISGASQLGQQGQPGWLGPLTTWSPIFQESVLGCAYSHADGNVLSLTVEADRLLEA